MNNLEKFVDENRETILTAICKVGCEYCPAAELCTKLPRMTCMNTLRVWAKGETEADG